MNPSPKKNLSLINSFLIKPILIHPSLVNPSLKKPFLKIPPLINLFLVNPPPVRSHPLFHLEPFGIEMLPWGHFDTMVTEHENKSDILNGAFEFCVLFYFSYKRHHCKRMWNTKLKKMKYNNKTFIACSKCQKIFKGC